MAGREYVIHTLSDPYWVDEGTWKKQLIQDPLKHPFSVLDGSWVLELFRRPLEGCEIVGVKPTQKILLEDHRLPAGTRWLLVGSEPFAVLQPSWSDADSAQPYGRRLKLARQIHKSELGRTPPIEKPRYLHEGSQNRRSRSRNRIGWARLTEVASVAGISVKALLTDYWPVIDYDAGVYYHGDTEPRIQMLESDDLPIINHERQVPVLTYERPEILRMLEEDTDWSRYWIRKGVANTILYLVHFGYSFEPAAVQA